MPSHKTGNISKYIKYLEYVKKHEDVLLKYNSVNTSRKWNFTIYNAKQQVYDRIHSSLQKVYTWIWRLQSTKIIKDQI